MNVTSKQFESVLRGLLMTAAGEIEQQLRKVNADIAEGNFADAHAALTSMGVSPAMFSDVMDWACLRHDTEKKERLPK